MTDPTVQIQPTFSPAAFAGAPIPDRDDNSLAFPGDSIVIHSLPFLPWDFSIPSKASLPGWALSFVLLPVCSFASDVPTQQRLDTIPMPYLSIAPAAVARILAALSSCGFFTSPIAFDNLRTRLGEALSAARTAGSQSAFTLATQTVAR
eukprot:5405289-Pleurochrysis_carterae.AAC.1